MNTIARGALLLLAVVGLVGIGAGAASADPPAKDVFFNSFTFQDTFTCPGMTIVQHNEEQDTFTAFSGAKTRLQRHGVATLSANGKTLTRYYHGQILEDPATVKAAWTVYSIQVPGAGHILLDAGNVVSHLSNGTVLHLAGPHQQLTGDVGELCAYLAA